MLKVDNMQGTGIIVVNRKKFVYKRGIIFFVIWVFCAHGACLYLRCTYISNV